MRITGGELRSRTLVAPRGHETRPTADRVREALFSVLVSLDGFRGAAADQGPRVLDLYAGSGALAFEALSRGAKSAVLVEHARPALAAIRENARSLGLDPREGVSGAKPLTVTVLTMRVERALTTLEGPFELIFLDPPYAEVRMPAFSSILTGAARLLAASGILVLEHGSAETPPSAVEGLVLNRSRRYGDTTLSFYVHQ